MYIAAKTLDNNVLKMPHVFVHLSLLLSEARCMAWSLAIELHMLLYVLQESQHFE